MAVFFCFFFLFFVAPDESIVPIDLGGAWLHGILGNPVAELALDKRLELEHPDYNEVVFIPIFVFF